MWSSWTAAFVMYIVGAVGAICSMDSLPNEYIHYTLSWDCKLVVTRDWSGSSLHKFRIDSDKLSICKSGRTHKLMHYVQVHPGRHQFPFLVFIIHFGKENGTNLNLWRVIRINIPAITYRKRLHRTILDSIFTEYSTLYTNYPLRTCAYHTVSSIYCFWQKGTEQWAQLYKVSMTNTTIPEYRAASEAFYLEGHPNFGEIVGSLPGPIPRVLTFDDKIRSWLYEVPVLNSTVSRRRIQEMRKIGKVFQVTCFNDIIKRPQI
uniref:Secreted protein n=1 Tax=Elaeophora elaphi TaxID=1147741 RepID=A0A0R3RSY0_9BILA